MGVDKVVERGPEVSLCLKCHYARTIKNVRGSVFFLCEKSKEDARFMKYPTMPVIKCGGYEERNDGVDG